MRYQDKQQIEELESLFIKLSVLIILFIAIVGIAIVLSIKGCSNEIAPVHFKEGYTPTKFDKL